MRKISSTFIQIIRNAISSREMMMRTAMEFVGVSKVYGDYLEFGVYRGRSFNQAYYFACKRGLSNMRFYAFDSFQGLPKSSNTDGGKFSESAYKCELDTFKHNIKHIPSNRVTIIPGWFKDTLKQGQGYNINKASVIWIDCDIYESTVPVLDFITPYLQDGTVIIFDDWFCYKGSPKEGEQRATSEWLERNPQIQLIEYHKMSWHGNSFLVHMR